MLKILRGWVLALTLLAPSLAFAGPDQMPPDSYVHITNPADVAGGGGTINNINNNTTTSSTTVNNSTTNNQAGGAINVTLVPPGGGVGQLSTNYFGSHPIANNPIPLGSMSISGPARFGAYQMNITPDGHAAVDITDKTVCAGVHYLSAATTNAIAFRSAPGALCGTVTITNSGSTTGGYLRFIDTAVSPTCTSANGIIWSVQIPVNATAANIAGIVIPLPHPIKFNNGLAICMTGAFSDTDNSNFVTGTVLDFGVQ